MIRFVKIVCSRAYGTALKKQTRSLFTPVFRAARVFLIVPALTGCSLQVVSGFHSVNATAALLALLDTSLIRGAPLCLSIELIVWAKCNVRS